MSLLSTKCNSCKKIFGYDANFKCSICNCGIKPNYCIQCHNREFHRFIPLSVRYGIKQYTIQVILAMLISANLYGIYRVVSL
jgi:hypothetical protein